MTALSAQAELATPTDRHILPGFNQRRLERLAEEVACVVRPGDLVTLSGALGAGKTTFARAFLRAMAGDPALEVPSPTFTLVQSYATARCPVAHVDLYRISDASELGELGLHEALARGLVILEWPERAEGALPPNRLAIALGEGAGLPPDRASDGETRDATLVGHGTWRARADRLVALHRFIRSTAEWAGNDVTLTYLQGDASVRRYARLRHPSGKSAVLMDWARQPDGPPIRDGKPYSRVAHLAEDARPYVAIAEALPIAGLRTPAIFAHDLDRGFLLIEDFGDCTFVDWVKSEERLRWVRWAEEDIAKTGMTPIPDQTQEGLWRATARVLSRLRRFPIPTSLPLPDGTAYKLPPYDYEALSIETELLLDWYWPAVHGGAAPPDARAEFLAAWRLVLDRVLAMERGWVLRDFHSPNLMWLEAGEDAVDRIGVLDFQDALAGPPAYDLVSLLQDARVDVAPDCETRVFEHYCKTVAAAEPDFDRDAFAFAYAALGAQRNTKILGIFARLAVRDGKPRYLEHIPRLWRYLERNLADPALSGLRSWYDRHLPPEVRGRSLAR